MRSSKYSDVTSSSLWRSSWAALLTSTVIGPNVLRTEATAFFSAAMSVRSQCSKWTFWRLRLMRATSAFDSFSLMSMKATFDPWAAKCSTMDSPMPDPPPVTRTVRPLRLG